MRLRFLCALAVFIGLGGSALSQATDRLDRRDKLLGYEAVGRLEGAGGRCTGALIERDVVLTAAHCIHELGPSLIFRAGFSHGAAIADRRAVDVVIADGYLEALARNDRIGETMNDVALVQLASPIFEPGAAPYAIARRPILGSALTLVSYGQGRMESLTLERGCRLKALYRGGVVGMNCSATFGSSGAPVFYSLNGNPRIFSIVSGGSDAETLGVELAEIVPGLLRELRQKRSLAPVSDGARRLSVGERPKGGIRFLKPDGS